MSGRSYRISDAAVAEQIAEIRQRLGHIEAEQKILNEKLKTLEGLLGVPKIATRRPTTPRVSRASGDSRKRRNIKGMLSDLKDRSDVGYQSIEDVQKALIEHFGEVVDKQQLLKAMKSSGFPEPIPLDLNKAG
ncbi:MAG: hypothetical protein H6923_07280 [Alphaproteobacteria bacterium]|nr:hypothetical protein [Alphaproteobacteria bacterium]